MALVTSGAISIGGSTVGRSINLELGRSATATSSLGESALRSLANDTSGAISMSTFYGKSNALDVQTVTVGYSAGGIYAGASYGFRLNGGTNSYGSIADGTCNFKSGSAVTYLSWQDGVSGTSDMMSFSLSGNHSNGGWTTMNINGTNYARTYATYTYDLYNNESKWYWTLSGTSSNPFGTTVGATKVVTFT